VRVPLAIFLIALVVTVRQASSQKLKFDPTSAYRGDTIRGFALLINPQVDRCKGKATEVRQEIERQLKNIEGVMPAEQLKALYKVRIWVEWNGKSGDASMFHPNADWLRTHGYNPEKAGDIEISDTTKFLKYSSDDQPWLLLHELAHAYHFHVLGENHPGIEKAFQKACAGGTYDNVRHVDGTKREAYAMKNRQEYFAELTEAYFGRNDYFPFTRRELELHDPEGYRLLSMLWEAPKKEPADGRS